MVEKNKSLEQVLMCLVNMLLLCQFKAKEPPDMLAGIMEGLQKWRINRRCFTAMKKGVCIVKRFWYLEGEKIEIHRTEGIQLSPSAL